MLRDPAANPASTESSFGIPTSLEAGARLHEDHERVDGYRNPDTYLAAPGPRIGNLTAPVPFIPFPSR